MSATCFSKSDRSLASLCNFCSLLPTIPLTSFAPAILQCSLCLDLQMFSLAFISSCSVLQMSPYFTSFVWQTPCKWSSRVQQSTLLLWGLFLPAPPPFENWWLLPSVTTFGAHTAYWIMLQPDYLLIQQLPCEFSYVRCDPCLIWHCLLST